jgi:hypothetical protein
MKHDNPRWRNIDNGPARPGDNIGYARLLGKDAKDRVGFAGRWAAISG